MKLKMQYIDYLECVLKSLSSNFSKGLNIDDIMSFYNKNSTEKIDRETQRHFEKLYENKYIERTGNSRIYKIIPEIKSIIDNLGSLSEYIELIEKEKIEKEDEENEIKKIQRKNLELQNENLEFSQTIRNQVSKIRDLELKIKGIELVKQYWWVIVFCILVGGILKEFLEILITYFKK